MNHDLNTHVQSWSNIHCVKLLKFTDKHQIICQTIPPFVVARYQLSFVPQFHYMTHYWQFFLWWCEINKRWLNPVWHRMRYSCTHMATVGVKGLINSVSGVLCLIYLSVCICDMVW